MVAIIKRTNIKADKQPKDYFQMSYNSDKHLVIRLFNKDIMTSDVIITFNETETKKAINFIKSLTI